MVFTLLPHCTPVTLFHACLTTATWKSWGATWPLEEGSVSSTCQTLEWCTEASAAAMATWRKARNATAVKKRSLLCLSHGFFPAYFPAWMHVSSIDSNLCCRNAPVSAATPTTALLELELSVPMVSAATSARYRSTGERNYHELVALIIVIK